MSRFRIEFLRGSVPALLRTLLAAVAAGSIAVACSPLPERRAPDRDADTPPAATPALAAQESIPLDPRNAGAEQVPPAAATKIPGTGVFVRDSADAVPLAASPARPAGEFQISFIDTDIATVVASVLGDALGLQYSIDPQVKGTMTLQASRPLARDELLPALESALRLQGFAIVRTGAVYVVVPAAEARRRGSVAPSTARTAGGFAVHILPLQYTSAAEMEKILAPLAPEGAVTRVDVARNLLLIAGTSQEIDNLRAIVEMFDVDWLAGMSFALYTLEYVDARTATGELMEVFGDPNSPIAGLVRLVPIPRLNAILAITPQSRYLSDVESWVKRLDVGGTTPGRRIYVYDVQNGKAADLAASLNRILSLADGGTVDGGASGDEAVGPRAAQSVTATTPGSVPSGGSTRGRSALEAGTLKIVPNEESNSLLILATPSEFGVVDAALKRLDIQPRQVLIEASLAEVTLTDELRYGVQWVYQGGDGPITLSESTGGGVASQFPGFSYLFTGRTDIRAVLNALESITDVDVISSPKLMVLNNREASLQIGDQVPIVVQSSTGVTDPNAPIVNAVQLRDTGVILKITPRVNKSGLVLLEIAQEVSDVVPTTSSGIDSPTIQQRKLSSTIAVRTGETIALGGLIRDSRSRTRSGVPYLARLPGLGALFRSTDRNSRRTELIVLITPRVIRDDAESSQVMQELRDEFKALERTQQR